MFEISWQALDWSSWSRCFEGLWGVSKFLWWRETTWIPDREGLWGGDNGVWERPLIVVLRETSETRPGNITQQRCCGWTHCLYGVWDDEKFCWILPEILLQEFTTHQYSRGRLWLCDPTIASRRSRRCIQMLITHPGLFTLTSKSLRRTRMKDWST
jgi:hypothetical protein